MKSARVRFIYLFVLLSVVTAQVQAAPRYTLLTMLHTNDLHGNVVSDTGGLARAATLIRQIRGEMPNVILLDAGDIIHGTHIEYITGGKATISAMNAAGYAAAAVGNHEFDHGPNVLANAIEVADFPMLAANIESSSGGRWDGLEPYRIIDVDGVLIGVFGLITQDTVKYQWPGRLSGIEIFDPITVAKALVPKMRSEVDVVVALSHLGDKQDTLLAKSVPGIDFIIGAHSHTPIIDWRVVDNTLITQATPYAHSVGRIDFIVRKDEGEADVISVNGKNGLWNNQNHTPLDKEYPRLPLVPVDSTIPKDEEVVRAYEPYFAESTALMAEVIGEASKPFPGGGPKSPAAKLAAEAVREFASADLAFVNAKSIADQGFEQGVLTVGSVYDLIEGYTRQHIVVGQVSGRDLDSALAKVFKKKGSVTWAVSAGFLGDSADNLKLEPNEKYTVAAQAYVMMDLINSGANVEVTSEPVETVREALVEYILRLRVIH